MTIGFLLALALLVETPAGSPFNLYAAHLEPIAMRAACRIRDGSYLGNLAYQFRGTAYPGRRVVQFKDGRAADSGVLSDAGAEWSTKLEREQQVALAGARAVLLVFFAEHLRGSGSASHVMVVRCRDQHLEVVFEAGGEGVRSSYSDAGELEITYPLWRGRDSHASPSRLIREKYRWDLNGRFMLVERSESPRRIP